MRESEHATMMAKGCWAFAVSVRRAAVGLPAEMLFFTKRALPFCKMWSAVSGGTVRVPGVEAWLGEKAKNAETMMDKAVAKWGIEEGGWGRECSTAVPAVGREELKK